MTKDQYEAFIDALLAAEKTEFKEGETAGYFDGCLPIEVMAERGRETLRFGPMKPVGLTNAHDPANKPYAVVQLRRDNALGTLYNIVGFQTKMKYGAQKAVFAMIPGLETAEFARRDGPAGRADGGGGIARAQPCAGAGDHRDGGACDPYHRRGRCQDVPADEREFRAVPAA